MSWSCNNDFKNPYKHSVKGIARFFSALYRLVVYNDDFKVLTNPEAGFALIQKGQLLAVDPIN